MPRLPRRLRHAPLLLLQLVDTRLQRQPLRRLAVALLGLRARRRRRALRLDPLAHRAQLCLECRHARILLAA